VSSTVLFARATATDDPATVAAALLEIAEDQWFDRKSFRIAPRELANVLIGFGNADGGSVVIGLSRGTIEGTDADPAHRNALMQAALDFCSPPVRSHNRLLEVEHASGEQDHLLVIEISPGESLHVNVRDEAYLRVGDETRKLTFAQRQELAFDRGQASYESRPLPGAGLEELDRDVISAYASALGHPDIPRLLRARGLAEGDDLTVAGCLLFSRAPQRYLPEAFVRVLRYRGRQRGTGARQQIASDERLEGPVPAQLVGAQAAVRAVQPTRRALGRSGRFEDVPLVPEDAWLEGIVNAAVHRSYSLGGDHIRIEVFDDRIEVESPGRFPGLVSLADPLNAPRFARNPRIARVCADQSFGQELGEGIRRMFEEMRFAGLADPIYTQTAASVRLVLSGEPVDRELEARLPDETRTIIAALRTGGRLSTGEVAEVLGLSRVSAGSRLRTLRDAGLVRWNGRSPRDPRAYWSLPPT